MNLSGLKSSGLSKCFGFLMIKWRLDMKVEFGGNVKPYTLTESLFW